VPASQPIVIVLVFRANGCFEQSCPGSAPGRQGVVTTGRFVAIKSQNRSFGWAAGLEKPGWPECAPSTHSLKMEA